MSRKGCKNKVHSGIYYPRKCDSCDYVSNNPSMFHYHKMVHEKIPDGKLCDIGCGTAALFRNTKGTYTCSKVSQHCDEYLRLHSERIKTHWIDNEPRKIKTKETFIKFANSPESRAKQKQTLRLKTGILTEERRTLYKRYAYACRKLAQDWAKSNGYETGRQTFHVDHIVSVMDGFKNEVPPSILSHPCNLRILEAKANSAKGMKSEMTVEELYSLIEKLHSSN